MREFLMYIKTVKHLQQKQTDGIYTFFTSLLAILTDLFYFLSFCYFDGGRIQTTFFPGSSSSIYCIFNQCNKSKERKETGSVGSNVILDVLNTRHRLLFTPHSLLLSYDIYSFLLSDIMTLSTRIREHFNISLLSLLC